MACVFRRQLRQDRIGRCFRHKLYDGTKVTLPQAHRHNHFKWPLLSVESCVTAVNKPNFKPAISLALVMLPAFAMPYDIDAPASLQQLTAAQVRNSVFET